MYLDALLLGRYPADVVQALEGEGISLPVRARDLDVIATPLDVLGVNYYFSERVRADDRTVREEGTTALGWPITPEGLTDLLERLAREYPKVPLVVTENGGAFADAGRRGNSVADADRIAFRSAHIDAVAMAHEPVPASWLSALRDPLTSEALAALPSHLGPPLPRPRADTNTGAGEDDCGRGDGSQTADAGHMCTHGISLSELSNWLTRGDISCR
jgi:hypothetical protein